MKTDNNIEKTYIQEIISPAKNIWQYLLVIFVLSALFMPLVWNGTWSWENIDRVFMALVWTFSIWITQIFGHTVIFHFWDGVFDWRKQPALRALVGIISMIIYASVAFIGVQILMRLIFFQEWPNDTIAEMIDDSMFAVKIAAGFSVFATLVGFLNAWRKSEVEKERLNTQMMEHKYNALQNQINPHFLFNSFNVLSELVYEDQELAVKFIRQLSDLYRYVLSVRKEDLVPLEKELEFIKSFLFLLETRFENRLEVSVQVDSSGDDYLVPMSLQLLIENAVKHNEATREQPLHISIFRDGDVLVVTNTLRRKNNVESSTQTGLSNIKERYQFLTGKSIEIGETQDEYTVKVPIVKVQDK